jgi:hypothetical protein
MSAGHGQRIDSGSIRRGCVYVLRYDYTIDILLRIVIRIELRAVKWKHDGG